MNRERLLEVADAIEASGRFNMCTWIASVDGSTFGQMGELMHNCATVGCVAGWAAALYAPESSAADVREVAAEQLGLSAHQCGRLFYTDEDSIWLRLAHEYGWTTRNNWYVNWREITAEQAADVLRRIAKHEVEL